MNKNIIQILYKISFFFCIVCIEYLATTSRSFKVVQISWDKANHTFAFFVLYALFSLSYQSKSFTCKAILLFLFGFQIEFVQHFLPYREFSFLDLFADTVGIIFGAILIKIIKNKNYL